MKQELIYPELSYTIVGILFSVHNELGRYKSEKQYDDAVEERLRELNIPHEREKMLLPNFSGEHGGRSKADFIVDNKIILEIKAKRLVSRDDYFQVKRYRESEKRRLGILVNFRQRYLSPKRILSGYDL